MDSGDIDSAYFVGELPEGPSDTGKWSQRWQNRKFLASGITGKPVLTLKQ